MTGSKHWLTDVLKTQLGFTGFEVSDWGAIDQVNPDYTTAVKQSINAGIDMAMVPDDWQKFESTLKGLVQSGDVSQARIDDAVSRILRVKFEMGLFENPMPPAGQGDTVGSAADRAVASQAVSESAVVLKTGAGVLPLAKTGKTVLLAGQGADDIGIASGGWTISWQGKAGNTTTGTTLNAALQAQLGSNLTYSADASFASGTTADVGIVVVAERPYAEGVGDSSTLTLPADDVALIAKVKPLVKKLIVVIYSGRRPGRRSARHQALHRDHALHVAQDRGRRAQIGQDSLPGCRLSVRLRPGRHRQAAWPSRLPVSSPQSTASNAMKPAPCGAGFFIWYSRQCRSGQAPRTTRAISGSTS
jgi:beta-glucosidase